MEQPKKYKEAEAITFEKKFLDDQAYADAVSSLVVVCADILIVNPDRKTVYLAKRKAKPMQDWWLIGGRIFAGEDEREAAARIFERETSIVIAPNEFTFLTLNRYFFKNRQQRPQNLGADSLSYTFALPVRDEKIIEQISAHLDSLEYDTALGLQEFDVSRLVSENVYQAVHDLYSRFFNTSL